MARLHIPETMRAAALDRFGGPRVLKIRRLPVPVPDEDEVLIAVQAAGVGSWDPDMRKGWWPNSRPTLPLVLGTDGAGVVVRTGSRVRRLHVRDRVYAYSFANTKGGFYAEYAAVPATTAVRRPARLSVEEAGAVPATGVTALQGIDDALKIRKGETLIIHGASGGVGTLAVQLAKWRGARVFATASGRRGVALVRRLGADAAVDGKRSDIGAAARRFAPEGVDAVLALAGGPALTQCLDALRKGGRVAYPNGVEPAPRKRRGTRLRSYDGVPGVPELQKLGRAIEGAKVRVPIAARYPLARAWQAHRRLERGHLLGRIVIRVD